MIVKEKRITIWMVIHGKPLTHHIVNKHVFIVLNVLFIVDLKPILHLVSDLVK